MRSLLSTLLRITATIGVAFLPDALRAGSVIEGTVELKKAHDAPVAIQRYEIVSKGGVLAPNPPVAVVYLEGVFPRPAVPPVTNMLQKDLTFVPALLPVQVGTRVEFPNEDNTYHNVFSYSPTKRFDLGRYRPEERPIPSQVFDVPGLVTLRCEIHEHMRAVVLVLDTPYFVTTDTAGHFRLAGLPVGKFKLNAWINSRMTLSTPVDLKPDAVLKLDLP